MNILNPYTLPAMNFVGGSTQDLAFYCYFHSRKRPHDLSTCSANFSIINFINKTGAPFIDKEMEVGSDNTVDGNVNNVLRVTLEPSDTVDLPAGKYIYQISIRDESGDVEIPSQGIIHIVNNINKDFAR